MSNSRTVKKYDFIFGIGRACACSQSLRRAGLQLLSLPWDWLSTDPKPDDADLPMRLGIMESGFSDWLREEDLKFCGFNPATGKDLYRNLRYPISYPHDFPGGTPLHESYPAVKEKYDRRVARLGRLISEAKSCVLAVYMDTPTSPPASVESCMEAHRRLQALFPNVKVDFLMLSLEKGLPFFSRTVEDLGGGFTRISFDFKDHQPNKPAYQVDIHSCAAAMKAVASVREYRTRAEIRAKKTRTRLEKMREAGANNAWEYFLVRRRRDLARLKEMLFPRVALARLRRRKYDHVLSLGMNCEPAFRFSLSWGFVDSTPFTWALCSTPECLSDALRHPEHIGAEGFSYMTESQMWKCSRTGMSFHGNFKSKLGNKLPPQDVLDEDRDNLVKRLAYLNGKLTRILSDDSSKALVYRVGTNVAMADGINGRLDDLQRALEERGARNYTLVVVVERAARGRAAPAPNRIVRSVKAFNPGESVVKEHLGDPVGWRALFAEITPAKILPKKHAFKFERE